MPLVSECPTGNIMLAQSMWYDFILVVTKSRLNSSNWNIILLFIFLSLERIIIPVLLLPTVNLTNYN